MLGRTAARFTSAKRSFATLQYPEAVPFLINGEFVAPSSGQLNSTVRDPATQEVLSRTYLPTAGELEATVQSAQAAFAGWSQTPVVARQRHLFRLLELVKQNEAELVQTIVDELGKTTAEATGDLFRGSEVIEHACSTASLQMGESMQCVSPGIDTLSYREPLGVVAGIVPFNYPAMMPLWMMPLAIATGNTFILKPSSRVPLTALRLLELCVSAGLPPGVVNSTFGEKPEVEELCAHRDIKAVSFVGGNRAGESIYELCAKHNTRAQCNTAAKNHVVIMPDASKEEALDALIGGAFAQCGQRCMSVPVAIFVGDAQEWISDLVPRCDAIQVGQGNEAGVTLGPLVTPEAKANIVRLVREGVESGATLLVDGLDFEHSDPLYSEGNFLGPTVMDGVTPSMECYTEELFGPVLQVLRAETYDDGLALVNASRYGNGSAIFTASGATARAFTREVEAGMVGVNVPVPVPLPQFSFTGWKDSMLGDLHMFGKDGVRFYTKQRTITSRW